MINNCQEVI